MKLVTYNIQYGLGRDGRHDLARVAGELTGADIIALQEVDRFWRRTGMVDGPEVLSRLLRTYHWVFAAFLDLDASEPDARGHPIPRRRQFGTMILSRWPVLSHRTIPLPKLGALTQYSVQQGLQEAVIDVPGLGPLRVYTTHLSHLCAATRRPQMEALMEHLARAPGQGGAWCGDHPDPDAGWTEGGEPPMPEACVLLGDLNCGPGDAEYDRMVGPLTPRLGRVTHRDGLVDAWVAAGHHEASGLTHPLTERRIDHCLVAPSLVGRVRAAWVDTAAQGSDHFPLWVDLET